MNTPLREVTVTLPLRQYVDMCVSIETCREWYEKQRDALVDDGARLYWQARIDALDALLRTLDAQ